MEKNANRWSQNMNIVPDLFGLVRRHQAIVIDILAETELMNKGEIYPLRTTNCSVL